MAQKCCSWFCQCAYGNPPPDSIVVTDPIYGEFTLPRSALAFKTYYSCDSSMEVNNCQYCLETTLNWAGCPGCPGGEVPVTMFIATFRQPFGVYPAGPYFVMVLCGTSTQPSTSPCDADPPGLIATSCIALAPRGACTTISDSNQQCNALLIPLSCPMQSRPWSLSVNYGIPYCCEVGFPVFTQSAINLLYNGPCCTLDDRGGQTLTWTFSEP